MNLKDIRRLILLECDINSIKKMLSDNNFWLDKFGKDNLKCFIPSLYEYIKNERNTT